MAAPISPIQNAWVLTQIRIRPQTVLNTYDAAQIDLKYTDVGPFTFRGGRNYKKYEFDDHRDSPLQRHDHQSRADGAGGTGSHPARFVRSESSTSAACATLIPDTRAAARALSLYDQTAYGGTFRLGREPRSATIAA